ncbi:GNAT family N-acetyltransferase [Anaerobiospirillum thomasii]|uniref:GNAT family N-acetyltransferase n=1 Tax=Anaerobiospirillum thomasii TaxID=179995 RepID=UPI0015593F43|nr:GNAT family N-acetyltransferase [Anaerobiospirillum thomasii]
MASIECKALPYEVRAEPWSPSFKEMFSIWLCRYMQKTHRVLLAFDDASGKAVGFLSMDGSRIRPYIQTFYVRPDFFRRGVGTALILKAEELVRQNGGKRLVLDVEVNNFSAIAFYQRHNFVQSRLENSHLIKMIKEL